MKFLFTLALFAAALFAAPAVGQPFPPTTLEDQFGKTQSITAGDRIVMLSFERDVSDKVNAFLGKQPKGFLSDHHAKYIADISAMPTIIAKLFALPKMRDYSYDVMLNRNEDFEKGFPKEEGKLTVYRLDDDKIVSVAFIDPEKLTALFAE